jgi:hypothetical protein
MFKSFFTVALLLSASISQAQNKANIENTINNLEQLGVKGILTSDTTILNQLWVPEFMVNTPRNTIAENRDAVLKIQKAGLINYRSFERVIEKMKIQENVVITMGYETFVSKNDIPEAKAGQPIKRRFTNVWMNKNGKWLQIARHASIICAQ